MNFFALPNELATPVLNLSRKAISRTDEFSFIIARNMAYMAAMDQQADRDSNVRGVQTAKYDNILSGINSLLPLNIQKVRDYTKAWASFRHDNIVGCIGAPYARVDSEQEDFFGISRYFDAEILKRLKDCPDAITQYHVTVSKLISYFAEKQSGPEVIASVN